MATEEEKIAVWKKGNNLRKEGNYFYCEDSEQNKIRYDAYGNRNDVEGWEIDHINPKSRGGGDELSNLQPLQWEANMEKANKIAYEDAIF